MTEHDLADLGDLEREVLLLVWRLETATADQVRGEVRKPYRRRPDVRVSRR